MRTSFRRALFVAPMASAITLCGFTGALAIDPTSDGASPVTSVAVTAESPRSTAAPAADLGKTNATPGNGTQGNGGHGSDGTVPGNGGHGTTPVSRGDSDGGGLVPAPASPDRLPDTPSPEQDRVPESTSPDVDGTEPSAPRPVAVEGRPDTSVKRSGSNLAPESGLVRPVPVVRASLTDATVVSPAAAAVVTPTNPAAAGAWIDAAGAPVSTSALPESLAYTGVGSGALSAGGLGALLLALGAALRLRRA